jgi:GntR family transcriptional regulator
MKCSRANEIPAYKRIQAAILKRVDVGQLKTGDLVESERKLSKIHGVSLMTARHALASLESEGIVERRGSSGTFVAPPQDSLQQISQFQ